MNRLLPILRRALRWGRRTRVPHTQDPKSPFRYYRPEQKRRWASLPILNHADSADPRDWRTGAPVTAAPDLDGCDSCGEPWARRRPRWYEARAL